MSCFSHDMHGFDRGSLEDFCAEEITEDQDTTDAELAADQSREADGCAFDSLMGVVLDCEGSHVTHGVKIGGHWDGEAMIGGTDTFCYTRCYRELYPEWQRCQAEFTDTENEVVHRFVRCAAKFCS